MCSNSFSESITMAHILRVLLLYFLLMGTHAEYCPTHCKCNYEKKSNCSMNNGNVTLELIPLTLEEPVSLIITCEGKNFVCSDLPQLEAHDVHKFQLSSCSPSILRCMKNILVNPKIDYVVFFNMSEPLTKDDVKDLQKVKSLKLLLRDNDIPIPMPEINAWSSITWAAISKGHLELSSNSFDHKSLRNLYLIDNKFSNWTNGAFSGLPNLRELVITESIVENTHNVSAGTFKGLAELRTLFLRDVSIKSVKAGAFADTPRLEILHLENNPLESLPNEFLKGSNELKRIVITCTSTKNQEELYLGSDAFANQDKLEDIRIGSCKLNTLSEDLFSNSNDILYVSIGDNVIKNISSKVFSNLSSLTMLAFDNNSLHELPDGLFGNLTALHTLNLANNRLVTLEENVFSDLTSLYTLNLSRNNIQELYEGTFGTLTCLVSLDLSHNVIKELSRNIFMNLTSLETLKLNNNRIHVLPEGIFASLTYLEVLTLDNNRIQANSENFTNLTFKFGLNFE